MTSEKMNQPMPMRKDMSTWLSYIPASLSRITVLNQPNIMSITRPAPMIMNRLVPSWRAQANPPNSKNRPKEPTIGHGEAW